ncbi:hypothetical protein Scep_029087 [Stephania cephalantha]|uniref:NB-ARC domain-containing protein n=1 Tax=Stephania cephalantha TaxID=152367 RepID=A0AAP0DX12_9MAGN
MDRLNDALENKRYLVVLDDLWNQQAWDDLRGAFPNGKLRSKVLLASRDHKIGTYADPQSQPVVPLNDALENKQYLVVLDDLWNQQAWDDLRGAFPNGKLRSKVLLASRDHKIGTYADPQSQPVVPEKLLKEEGWALFCKKAFNDDPSNCPKDLKDYGEKMVEKCGGLPLAIIVLRGLLSTKRRSVYEWDKVLRNMNWNLGNEEQLKTMIAKTYEELSYHLKSCFIYMSLFPEDCHIKRGG